MASTWASDATYSGPPRPAVVSSAHKASPTCRDDPIPGPEDVQEFDARRVHITGFQRHAFEQAGLQVDAETLHRPFESPVARLSRARNLNVPLLPGPVHVVAGTLVDEAGAGVQGQEHGMRGQGGDAALFGGQLVMRDVDVRPAQVVTRHRDMGRAYRQGRHRRVGRQRCELLCLHSVLSVVRPLDTSSHHGGCGQPVSTGAMKEHVGQPHCCSSVLRLHSASMYSSVLGEELWIRVTMICLSGWGW